MFRQFSTDMWGQANSFWTPALPNLDLETHKLALYNNTPTPDFDAVGVLSCYNGTASQWVTANEAAASGTYVAGGLVVTTTAVSVQTGNITRWAAANWSVTSFTGSVYGCLIYADSITAPSTNVDQGIVAITFGGVQTATAGTFQITWAGTGIYQKTG